MNEIDLLAKERFNGDLQKTAEYIFTQLSPEEQRSYTKNITTVQANEFVKFFEIMIEQKGIDVQKIANEEYGLASMSLTKEEVAQMETNPFKAKLGKDILKFVILNVGLAAIYLGTSFINKDMADSLLEPAVGIASLINTVFSFQTVRDMLNYFKFKKLKKQYENEKYPDDLKDINRRGK